MKNRDLKSKTMLEQDCNKVLMELNLNLNTKLTRAEVRIILDILGLELTTYQKGELHILIEKAHCFNGNALKRWIIKNRRFIICKYLGRSLEGSNEGIKIKRLPVIKFKESLLNVPLNKVALPGIKTPLKSSIHI